VGRCGPAHPARLDLPAAASAGQTGKSLPQGGNEQPRRTATRQPRAALMSPAGRRSTWLAVSLDWHTYCKITQQVAREHRHRT